MKIMIFDVPAVEGGALTVLRYFEKEVKRDYSKDIEWIFITSEPFVIEENNVSNLRFPWVKKSWFHRLFFDYLVAPRLIKKYHVDKIVSLQNLAIPFTKVKQYLYVHQSLPFTNIRFSIMKNWKMWIYQNLIGQLIFLSIRKAHKVIVQTKWMKTSCIEKIHIDATKIEVVSPEIEINVKKKYIPTPESMSTFFFPAAAYEYKNHSLIIEACKQINKKCENNYKVIFTIEGNENEEAVKLKKEAEKHKINIQFQGNMSRQEVFEQYSKSVLLFPSYIETFGLPLLEARLHQSIVLASSCEFSNEILKGYKNASFFDPMDARQLSELLNSLINQNYVYHSIENDDSILKQETKLLKNVILSK